jgi:hypothetical protein
MNYAVINKETKIVENNIEWDGESYLDPQILENCDLISWDQTTKGAPVNLGCLYDETVNGFIPIYSKPFPSWSFNFEIVDWESPIPDPSDEENSYTWNESEQCWDLVVPPSLTGVEGSEKTPDELLQEIIDNM